MKYIIFIACLVSGSAWASDVRSPNESELRAPVSSEKVDTSAARELDRDWRDVWNEHQNEPSSQRKPGTRAYRTAADLATPYVGSIDVTQLPEWPGDERSLLQAFYSIRDQRDYSEEGYPTFARRSSWLYPRDGCFVRAVHASQQLEQYFDLRPGKVFAFGNLEVQSPYSNPQRIGWWYHVAVAFRFGQRAVVFDPSVDARAPMEFSHWMQAIHAERGVAKVAVCDAYAYTADRPCRGSFPSAVDPAVRETQRFLRYERETLRDLGFDVDKILGEQPPWRTNSLF